MLNWLRRIFIKNYEDVENPKVRFSHGIFAAVFGIITNLIIAGIKITAALILASQNEWILPMALVGDAANNFSDMGTSIVTLIGFKMSSKPADKEHPFGHERIEYIAGLIVSIIVVVVGIELARDSIGKVVDFFQTGVGITYDMVTIIILFVSILLKVMQSRVNKKIGNLIDSLPLLATAEDSRNDALATFGILLAAIFSILFNITFLDGFAGIIISILVILSGVKMAIETAKPLIGEATDKDFVKKIVNDVLNEKLVVGVHDVICHSYGPTKIFISLHAEVDQKEDIILIHDAIDNIEESIRKKYGCEITIHMDPVAVGDPIVDSYKTEVSEVLVSISKELKMHDFRVVKGKTHTNLIFDVVLPFDKQITQELILESLKDKFKNRKQTINFVIHFDIPFAE